MQLPDEIAGYRFERFRRNSDRMSGYLVRTKTNKFLVYVTKSDYEPDLIYLNINTYDQISLVRYSGDALGVYNEVLKFFNAEREREDRAAAR